MHVACKLHLSRCSARGIFLPRCKILGGGCLPVTCTLDSGPRVFMIQFYMPSCMPSRVCFSHSIPRSRHVSYWAEIPTCILHQSPFFYGGLFSSGTAARIKIQRSVQLRSGCARKENRDSREIYIRAGAAQQLLEHRGMKDSVTRSLHADVYV
jgi:hypothetical protein